MNPDDFTTHPRYIEETVVEGDEIGELVATYERELADLNGLKEMFELPAWRYIMDAWHNEATSLDRKARQETEPQQWFLWRGQSMTLWYLLDLPDRVEKRRRVLLDTYRRLVGEEE